MTENDRGEFGEAFFILCETFGEPISDLRTEGYFTALEPHAMSVVKVAMVRAMRECKFFPKPVELREFIEGRAEDAAEQAWGAVLREIRRVGYLGAPALDARTLRAVKELWGSWSRLCETLPAEGPELVGWIKQFKATHLSAGRETHRELTMADVHPDVRAFIVKSGKALPERVQ